MRRTLLLACISLTLLRGADEVRFDAASVRPQAPGDNRFRVNMPTNGRFHATGIVVKMAMMIAYDVQESQISGGPSWFGTEKWDIDAKCDEGTMHSVEETHRMVQNLLRERFGLRIHRETQQLPAYVLTVARGGPKFKTVQPGGRPSDVHITGNAIDLERGELARVTQLLSAALGRPVVDRTGLNGLYNLSLKWDDAPNPGGGVLGVDVPAAPGMDRGSIFTAIQEQLGLRLEPQRVPVEVIVIDRLEKATAN